MRIDFPVGYWFTEIKSHGDDLMVEICRGELTKSHRDGLIGWSARVMMTHVLIETG